MYSPNNPRRIWAGATIAVLAGTALLATTGGPAVAEPVGARADLSACPWMDTSKSPAERAEILLGASSQHQKYRWLVEQPANAPQQTDFRGIVYPAQLDCTPTIVYTDGPDGVRGVDGVTAFPAQISLASTWDTDLAHAKGAAQADEAWEKGKAGVLGPGISSSRTPLAGRTSEYLGEDPLLSGVLGGANTKGLASGDPDKPTMTVLKHYVANEQESFRTTSSSNIDERTFHETYALPFEILDAQGDPAGVMCSYNQINGVYACENPLLTTNLRDQLGFDGFVMSDFNAVHSTAPSLNAGLDQELNRPVYYTPDKLDAALAAGEISQATIDRAAFRVVKSYIAAGLFDKPAPATPAADTSTAEHKQLAKRIAEEGSVLLKNDGILPLGVSSGTKIALIGATVSNTPTGGISTKSVCSMIGFRSNTMNCEDVVAPDTSFPARAAQEGATVTTNDGSDHAAAAALAADSDVAIVFGYRRSGEFTDIPDLSLENGGDDLVSAVAAANPRTVVVLETGSATAMPWLDKVGGVLQAWYPGEQQGPALASLLWGDTNPSGKLPMTFPKSLADVPTSTEAQFPGILDANGIHQVDYSEGLAIGHKWYDAKGIEPLFEFGHGLSYTSFGYSDLALASSNVDGVVKTTASFTVTNTGSRAGSEVPQAYLTLPAAAEEPGKRLVGWDRVTLEPGASTRVSVDIDSSSTDRPYSVWSVADKGWKTVSGTYTVSVGSSSRGLPLVQDVVVDAEGVAPSASVALSPAAPTGDEGWYVDPVVVSASATDDVDPAPRREIAIDGAAWTSYDAPVTVSGDGSHVVEVRATDAGGATSPTASASVRIDTTAPTVSARLDDARTVTLEAADATAGVARIEYATVSSPEETPSSWSVYSEPVRTATTATTLAYRAVDHAGNTSATAVISVPAASTGGAGNSTSVAPAATDLARTGGTMEWTPLIAGGLLVALGTAVVAVRRGVRARR